MAFQDFFPVNPADMTWESWNGNLLVYFSEEPIPYLPEEQWTEVAYSVTLLPTFSSYPVPSPMVFKTWQDWALEFTLIINGPST